MAWCLAILLLLALLAPGALQEAAWRPLTALLPQLATLALPFMATSLVSLRDTLSLSLVTVAVVVVVLGRRPRASYAPRCQKRSFFLLVNQISSPPSETIVGIKGFSKMTFFFGSWASKNFFIFGIKQLPFFEFFFKNFNQILRQEK